MKKVITPVVTEDIVSYLLRYVNKDGTFSRVYSCVMSEAIIIRAWFEIKSRPWRFARPEWEKYNNSNKVENLALSWVKKVSKQLILNKYNYKCTRVVTISKKNIDKSRICVFHLYDRVVQKAVYKILHVIFEGYFCWKKISKEMFSKSYSKAINNNPIVKRKECQEYWFRYFKVKPVFLSLSCHFRLKKEVYSVVRVIRTWNPRWFVSYDFSKLLHCIDRSIFANKLRKYIEDKRLTSQIIKLLEIKIANTTTAVPKGAANVFQSNLILFFNFYIHSFDKFVGKVALNVSRRNHIRSMCGSIRIKKLPVTLNIQKGILSRETRLEETSAQIHHVRFNHNFLMGFMMSKAQSRWVMEDLFKYIKEKLNVDVPKKLLRHISSDKTQFLGFEIHRISAGILKQSLNKNLEVYKRHQNKNFREGVRDYIQFLKAVEWINRETLMGVAVKKIISQKHILAEKKLKKRITRLIPQEYWFYYRSKPHQKMELALRMRYEDPYFRLHKWVNAKKGFLNSRNSIRLIRVGEKNQSYRNKQVAEFKYERIYPLKLQCVTTNAVKMKSILAFKILFSKKQVMAEFKRKNVFNSQGASRIVVLKTVLSDIAIICWYSRMGKKLLSYYGCITSFNNLRYQVNSIFRYSLFKTIRVKYNKSMSWVISHFGFDPKVKFKNQLSITFPSLEWINSRRKKYITQAWGKQNLDFMRNSNLLYLNQTGIMLDNFKYKNLY